MNDKLATIQQTTALAADPYAPDTFDRAMVVAENIAKSRLFGITSREAAFVILATGHELGLSPMQSLRGIHIIEGKPSPSADAIHAVVLNSGLAEYFREVETTADHSTWETKRKGSKPVTCTFNLSDAKRANLVKPNGNWEKYPQRMLKARAKAFLARDVYPDLLLGLYIPDELTEGRVESVEAPAPVQTIEYDAQEPEPDPVEQVEAAIKTATLDDLPALANKVRELCPKGHPARERLAIALTVRKSEVSRAA
ncbi:MAG TPA: hypothetical protein DEB56_14720 [Thiobacillus sp.]|nr:hypothetical protein [Thiobacillus sp.]